MDTLQRYRAALAKLNAKIPVLSDTDACNFLSRYLFGTPQDGANMLYKYATNHRPPSVRFLPPSEPWRLLARTEALETLCRLPASLLQALIVGGIDAGLAGRRATLTAHEMGGEIAPAVHAFWTGTE